MGQGTRNLAAANVTAGTPPANDTANAYVAGTFTAAGQTSQALAFYGPFNVTLWSTVNQTLTTTSGSLAAQLGATTGVAAGETIISVNLPKGATVATLGGNSITLGGITTAQLGGIVSGADTAALFVGNGSEATGTVQLERSFDGGTTWVPVSEDKIGTPASYQFGSSNLKSPVSIAFAENAETGVAYRLNCTALSSGTINYRISATGGATATWMPQS